MSENVLFEDLYDIERRPGAGLNLWTKSVEHQLARVHDVGYRLRLAHAPNEDDGRPGDCAAWQLQMEVYFLVLAIRRLVLFHDLLAQHISDQQLVAARKKFMRRAPAALRLRNFYEHLDEYLLDGDMKHMKEIRGRAAPVLKLRWDADNVVVSFGDEQLDVSMAAEAAIELGRESAVAHETAMAQVLDSQSAPDLPSTDGTHMLDVVLGRLIEIGGDDEGYAVVIGAPLDVRVREMTPEEASARRSSDGVGAGGANSPQADSSDAALDEAGPT